MLVFLTKFIQVVMRLYKFSNVILKRLRGVGDRGAWRTYKSGCRLRGVSNCAAGGPTEICVLKYTVSYIMIYISVCPLTYCQFVCIQSVPL